MNNPFTDLLVKPDEYWEDDSQQQIAKREVIYSQFDPMVNEILDLFIAAHRPDVWEKDSDCSRRYCCHVSWFAGPRETHRDPYDPHHAIRRRLEIGLEMDGLCHPIGFKVTHYEAIDRIVHVGLSQEDLIRGIKAVFAT